MRETRAMLDSEWYKLQPARVKEPCCVLSIAARSGVREFPDPARQLPRPVRELSKSVQWFLAWSGSFRKLQDMVRGGGGQFCETTHPCVWEHRRPFCPTRSGAFGALPVSAGISPPCRDVAGNSEFTCGPSQPCLGRSGFVCLCEPVCLYVCKEFPCVFVSALVWIAATAQLATSSHLRGYQAGGNGKPWRCSGSAWGL